MGEQDGVGIEDARGRAREILTEEFSTRQVRPAVARKIIYTHAHAA